MELFDISSWAIVTLLSIVAWFLRGVFNTLKQLEKDFSMFRENYAGHKQLLTEHTERITKIEAKLEDISDDIRNVFIELARSKKS